MASTALGLRASYLPKKCLDCPKEFKPIRRDQVYCSGECKQAAKNRSYLRAMQLYPWCMVLVTNNKERGTALNAITQACRKWRDQDRAAGREPPSMMIRDWPG